MSKSHLGHTSHARTNPKNKYNMVLLILNTIYFKTKIKHIYSKTAQQYFRKIIVSAIYNMDFL